MRKENKFLLRQQTSTKSLWGMNCMAGICVLGCFFFFCLLRIFVYLRFPGGNCGLSVCSVRVSASDRERASMWVSPSVCNVLSSWTPSSTPLPSDRDNSCQAGDNKPGSLHFSLLFIDPIVRSANLVLPLLFWIISPDNVMFGNPPGFWTLF